MDHVEEVHHVEAPSGAPVRAFILCPVLGRVFVPLTRLQRWEVNLRRLADLAAAALGTAEEVEEVVSGRVWLLGKTTLAGVPHDIFWARGLGRSDGADVIGRAERLRVAVSPIVVVAGPLPNQDVWGANAPRIVAVTAVFSLQESGLAADRRYLQSALGNGSTTPRANGVEGGCWLWWNGKRHDIPKGVVYRLIAHMWDRDSALYDNLDGPVFEGAVEPGTVRARVSDANGVLKKTHVPWRLKADATSRILTKHVLGSRP
jgi:hypothetical protein